jgi:hypothetical protein
MAHVPEGAEWFLADLVQEIRVAGSKRNIVHINYVIIHARSPEAAYARAMSIGKRSEMSYENLHGKKVTIRFRGLGNLDMIYDPLGDECEIMYREKLGVTEKGIRKMVRPKRKLEVFMPIRERPGRSDFSSQEVMNELAKRSKGKR